MPELRSSAWSAVQSFPAPDGSRTLRVNVVNEVIEALQSRALRGIRQSYLWGRQLPTSAPRLMTETEVLTPNSVWMPLPEWLLYRGGGSAKKVTNASDYRLPPLVIAHLKCGRIKSVKHTLEHDRMSATGIKEGVTIEAMNPDGSVTRESLEQYMRRENAAVEMCVPLSSEEATAFFNLGSISGVRHSWISNSDPATHGDHIVEIRTQDEWSALESNEVFVWNNVVTPHFRFIFTGGADRKKENINSPTPWV